jgi:hypothetical protein
MAPALRLEMLRVAEVDERVEAGDRFEHDVAALAAIAAVRAAVLDVFLAAERHRARPAGARLEVDLGLVEEMHGGTLTARRELVAQRGICLELAQVEPKMPDSEKPGRSDPMVVSTRHEESRSSQPPRANRRHVLVEPRGIEPLTSSLRTTRSPS